MKLRDLKSLRAFPKAKIRFIEPMYALAVQNLPEGKEWLYEIKLDGYRALAGKGSHGVNIWSSRPRVFIFSRTNQTSELAVNHSQISTVLQHVGCRTVPEGHAG